MPRVYLLASDPEPDTLLGTLAPALPRDRFMVSTGQAPFLPLREPFAALRVAAKVVAFSPHILHAIGPDAVKFASILTGIPQLGLGSQTKLILTDPAMPDRNWLTRRAVWRASQVIVSTHDESHRLAVAGVPTNRLTVIPPGVDPDTPPPLDPVAFRQSLRIPESARIIVAAGRFDPNGALADLAFAFDVLKYPCPDCYLVFVGTGPERARAERFAKGVGFDDYRTRFANPTTDLRAVLALAELVWVPESSLAVPMALHAMACGKAVVGTRTPALSAIIDDGVTGRFVAPGHRVGFAETARELLSQSDKLAAMGVVGRERARENFLASQLVQRCAALYDDVIGSPR